MRSHFKETSSLIVGSIDPEWDRSFQKGDAYRGRGSREVREETYGRLLYFACTYISANDLHTRANTFSLLHDLISRHKIPFSFYTGV